MKDVTSCDKLRLGANNLLVVDFRMGQPSILKVCYHACVGQTRGTETSKYPEEEKIIMISLVAASERETAQTNIVSAMLGL